SPALLIAATCSSARSTNVMSCPARARCAPIVPPIAPAPQTRNFMALGSAALGESVADQTERDADEQPIVQAASTYPTCRVARVVPRVMRAYGIRPTTPTAMYAK